MKNKSVTNTAKLLISIWNIGLFLLVWTGFYNKYTFDSYMNVGAIISIIVYAILYNAFCKLYKAFRIASSSIGETVFSQLLAFGISDLILYVECCLIYNRYVNILPGMIAVMLQIVGTSVIVTLTKRYFMKYIPPKNTLLLYGTTFPEQEVENFRMRLLKKYNHLFQIVYMERENISQEELQKKMRECSVLVLHELSKEKRGEIMQLCIEENKQFYFSPRVEDILCQGCTPKHLLDTPLMKYDYTYENKSGSFLKRTFDIVFSLTILVILSPVLLLVALLIKIEDGGPIFYKQKRCTKDGKVFDILKFRSMVVDAEKEGATPCTENDKRITKIGKWIRMLRVDEIPQFLNILKGDMSIVGPRPERVEHVEQYIKEVPEFAYRMRVKGGLTGYAQIYGKYNTSAYDKLRLDLMYIENQSFLLDLKLVMLTVRTIFTPESTEGFSEEKSTQMKKIKRG